ncbi:hypothetical protein EDD63_13321, partial [Breznakia blatticola]
TIGNDLEIEYFMQSMMIVPIVYIPQSYKGLAHMG